METLNINKFRIADHNLRIIFHDSSLNSIRLVPSLEPFRYNFEDDEEILFQLTVDDTLKPVSKEERERIRTFDTGNGDTVVDQLADGGYQYIIRDTKGNDCCLLQCNKDFSDCHCALNGNYNMRCFGLNNALMLIFAFAGCQKDTLLIHASLVRQNGYGYAFIAKSGTGKSTQVSLWLRHIPGCDLMNDDNPIVRVINGEVFIYGGPWSGKTPCYRNVSYPLSGIVVLSQAPYNKIQRLSGIYAYAALVESISGKRWDERIADGLHQTENALASSVPVWHLECLPDEAAARLCCSNVTM